MTPLPLQLVGVGTLAYGLYALARPGHIARHGELGDPDHPPAAVAVLSRVLGVRDVASGASLLLAPAGSPRRITGAVRVAFDLGDAAAFGTALPTARARRKVAAVALAWAALSAAALVASERP